jgi:hypothetical protein
MNAKHKKTKSHLVPTRCVGIHTDRAAVYNAARCHCIPTRRVGTREQFLEDTNHATTN